MATAKKAVSKPTTKAASAPAAAKAKPAAKPVAKAATPAAAKKPAAKPAKAKAPGISPEVRHYYVEVAAYYIAERRGFNGGSELNDWIEAENEIDRLLKEGILNP